jgi:hypothetical protein
MEYFINENTSHISENNNHNSSEIIEEEAILIMN